VEKVSDRNIITVLAEEISAAFLPLLDAVSSTDSFTSFALELGWNFVEIPQPIKDLSIPLQTINDIIVTGDVNVSNVVALIDGIKSFIEGVKQIKNQHNSLFPSTVDANQFKNEFPNQLIQYLIVQFLLNHHPFWGNLGKLLGLIHIELVEATSNRPSFIKKEIFWDQITRILENPVEIIKNTYQWGGSEFKVDLLVDNIMELARSWNIDIIQEKLDSKLHSFLTRGAIQLDTIHNWVFQVPIIKYEFSELQTEIGIGLFILPETASAKPGFSILPYGKGKVYSEIDLTDELVLKIVGGIDLTGGIGILFRPQKNIEALVDIIPSVESNVIPPSSGFLSISLNNRRLDEDKEYNILIGEEEGSRLEYKFFSVNTGLDLFQDNKYEVYGEIKIQECHIIIVPRQEDGFLQKILPEDGIETTFDLTIGLSSLRGLYFGGSATLEITLPVHKSIGPIDFDSVYLAVKIPKAADIVPITLTVSFSAKIGPISASIKNIGIIANLSFPEGGGNLGPVNLNLGFKWPTGVGLSIDASGLTGGGYLEFDPDNGRYVGILQLQFSEIGLLAITLITTKMPDGSKGFSMLSMINVSFSPAISLPYNFKLHAVGGLLGIHRTMKIDVIRDGLKNGILDSVMFPEGDVIQRAPQIISDLRSIFPPTEDRYIIGLMAKLSWSELIFGDIGLFIEVPMPIKIAILGQIYTYLPSGEDPIVEIHLDILGELKLEQKKLYLIASIYNSRILKFNLSGDGYIGVSWGDKPYFVLSLGGFHPKDKSIPSDVPALRRLKLSIGKGNNPRLSLETYFAITSATLGFGAKLELYAKAGKFSIEGYLGFDTLFIYSPFSFEVELGGGVAVKAGGKTLLSISLDMSLDGPTPWHAKGKAKFKILFFEVKVKFDKKWGKKKKATLPSVDPWPDLEEALKNKKSWSGALPEEQHNPVQIRLVENTGTEIVVFPTGFLEIRQNILPLGVKITKYKNTKPAGDISQFDISHVYITKHNDEEYLEDLDIEPALDYFARPQYQEMSDSEKLSSPAYEKLESGKRCQANDISISPERDYLLVYETEVIDENKCARRLDPSPCIWMMSKFLMKGGIAAYAPIMNSGSTKYRVPVILPKGGLVEEAYAIVNTSDMTLVESEEIPNNGNSTYVQKHQSMEQYLTNHPEQVGEIQIVPQSEVNMVNG